MKQLESCAIEHNSNFCAGELSEQSVPVILYCRNYLAIALVCWYRYAMLKKRLQQAQRYFLRTL